MLEDRRRYGFEVHMQEGKEEQGRETQVVSMNSALLYVCLWCPTILLLHYYRLLLKDFQKTTAQTKESNLFKCRRPKLRQTGKTMVQFIRIKGFILLIFENTTTTKSSKLPRDCDWSWCVKHGTKQALINRDWFPSSSKQILLLFLQVLHWVRDV